jgi:hypothetical protein
MIHALTKREEAKWMAQQQRIAQHAKTNEIHQAVEALMRFIGTFSRENPNLYRLVWAFPQKGDDSLVQSRQIIHSTVEYFAQLLTQGMDRGIFERREPVLAAYTALGMVNMSGLLFQLGKIVEPELRDRMEEETIPAAMDYLRKRT